MDFEEINILILKGVFLNDCKDIEDIFEDELIQTTNTYSINEDPKIYNKIPSIFTTKELWIKKTNILCWYCNLSFSNMPVFIPLNISKNENGQYMEVYGNFCSFSCAQGFINNYNDYFLKNKWQIQELLKLLYRKMYNKTIDIIYPSPSKYTLEKYGGSKKEKQFKEEIININLKNHQN